MASESELFSTDFKIVGTVPYELLNKFLETQVTQLGIHGWVEKGADEAISGQIEGNMANLDKFKETIKGAQEFAGKITDVTFGEMKKIDKNTFTKFEVK